MNRRPRLPPGQQWAAPQKWPRVGEARPSSAAGWTGVELGGLVSRPQRFTFAQLAARPQVDLTTDIHCVTRWSKAAVRFRGVPLADLLRDAAPRPDARFVRFEAHSDRRHSTSLPLAAALDLFTLLALEVNGEPLPVEAGGPLRSIVPGRYFYKSLKWLARIELLEVDRPGYWEAEAGYHNEAEPWREQRFVAGGVDRIELARRLESLDFRDAELLGAELAERDLSGLQADGARLRNADLRRTRLVGASFRRANLSNARLLGADLRDASFADADVEGADFRGADLRGADFRGASALGVTWTTPSGTAASDERRESPYGETLVDSTTQFDPAIDEQLAPEQADWLRARRGPR